MEGRGPWHHVGNRIGGNPFTSLGLDWCPRCRLVLDMDTEAGHRAGVYTYRRRCGRCGRVVKFGAYAAPLVSDRPLPAASLAWVTQPGKDRR